MKKDVASALRALASNNQARSKMGQLRELYPEIEQAYAAGVSLNKIVEVLNQHGLDLTPATFRQMLQRIRKEIAGSKIIPSSATITPKKEKSEPKKPGEPEQFNWEKMKNQKVEW